MKKTFLSYTLSFTIYSYSLFLSVRQTQQHSHTHTQINTHTLGVSQHIFFSFLLSTSPQGNLLAQYSFLSNLSQGRRDGREKMIHLLSSFFGYYYIFSRFFQLRWKVKKSFFLLTFFVCCVVEKSILYLSRLIAQNLRSLSNFYGWVFREKITLPILDWKTKLKA